MENFTKTNFKSNQILVKNTFFLLIFNYLKKIKKKKGIPLNNDFIGGFNLFETDDKKILFIDERVNYFITQFLFSKIKDFLGGKFEQINNEKFAELFTKLEALVQSDYLNYQFE